MGLTFGVLLVPAVMGSGSGYDYSQNGADWGGMCAIGTMQSPQLIGENRISISEELNFKFNEEPVMMEVLLEDGLTLKLTPIIEGSMGGVSTPRGDYELLQFHFHSSAEHCFEVDQQVPLADTIGSKFPEGGVMTDVRGRLRSRLPKGLLPGPTPTEPTDPTTDPVEDCIRRGAEVHLVHRLVDPVYEQGMEFSVAPLLLVVGLTFDRELGGRFDVQPFWNGLKPIFKQSRMDIGQELLEIPGDLFKPLLELQEEFAIYMGSLTTPPCSEGVQWVVGTSTLKLYPQAERFFQDFIPGSFRLIQENENEVFETSQVTFGPGPL